MEIISLVLFIIYYVLLSNNFFHKFKPIPCLLENHQYSFPTELTNSFLQLFVPMSHQRKKYSPSSHNSSISSKNLQGSSNVHPSNIGNLPAQLVAVLPTHHNHVGSSNTRSNNADGGELFSQFGSSLIPSTPKQTEVWYTQEPTAKTVADT